MQITSQSSLKELAESLNLCQFNCPVITVAGTNGKGTCIETLRYFLNMLGFKVGVYTSPHVFEERERIKINEDYISSADWQYCSSYIYNHLKQFSHTYFEFITLVALYYLKQQNNLDFILLEIGLGGRLDPVNIVHNDIAVITSIGLDHCEQLGNTKLQIAKEKAGIIKTNNYVVCGEREVNEPIKNIALLKNAKLEILGVDYSYSFNKDSTWNFWCSQYELNNLNMTNFPVQNVATAFMVLNVLIPKFWQKINVAEQVGKLALLGRFMQVEKNNVHYIIDCAHNPDAATWLANKCKIYPNLYVIFGCCKDKDYAGMIAPFLAMVQKWYIVKLANERSATVEELSQAISNKASIAACISLELALKEIEESAIYNAPKINVVIFGSFYIVEEALRKIK